MISHTHRILKKEKVVEMDEMSEEGQKVQICS